MERRIHWVLDGVFNEDQSRGEPSYFGIPTGLERQASGMGSRTDEVVSGVRRT
jgi:hypothetical protein